MNRIEGPPDTGIDFSPDWPYVKSENLTVLNPEASTAIVSLWTPRNKIIRELSSETQEMIAAVGQLYSLYGINRLIRNLLANENIRYLVVSGVDISDTGKALIKLWECGVDEDRKIVGIEDSRIDDDLPLDAIERLTREVKLVTDYVDLELRELPATLEKEIPRFPERFKDLSPRTAAEYYPMPEVEVPERKPSLVGAEFVHAETVGEAWLKILKTVLNFGERRAVKGNRETKDLHNLVVVITEEDPFDPEIFDFFNFTGEKLERHIENFFDPVVPKDLSHTYGERLYCYGEHEIDQVKIVVNKLIRDPHDRGAIAVLHDPYKDNQLSPETKDIPWKDHRTPCLALIQSRIVDGQLAVTVYFRSNEMFAAWPTDALAVRRWQGIKAREIGKPAGPLTIVSSSAHINDENWKEAQEILAKYGKKTGKFRPDPRGNFRIRVEDGNIVTTHQDEQGFPLGPDIVWNGERRKASVGLGNKLAHLDTISSITHALDVGRELIKAELAAKAGLLYTQDSDQMVRRIVERLKRLEDLEASLGELGDEVLRGR